MRNNALTTAIMAAYPSILACCRKNELHYGVVHELVTGKRSPFRSRPGKLRGQYTPTALRIAESLRMLPEDLFPGESESLELMPATDVPGGWRSLARIADREYEGTQRDEDAALIPYLLTCLRPREQKIIALRYGENTRTLKELGRQLNLSRERIRQIEQSAINRMKTHFVRLLKVTDQPRTLIRNARFDFLNIIEQQALKWRYGLGGYPVFDVQAIGGRLKMKPAGVRSIIRRALARLRGDLPIVHGEPIKKSSLISRKKDSPQQRRPRTILSHRGRLRPLDQRRQPYYAEFGASRDFLCEMRKAARKYRTADGMKVTPSHFMRVACAKFASTVLGRNVEPHDKTQPMRFYKGEVT